MAGIDYRIKEHISETYDWVPLPENERTEAYRHDWVFKRNRRPCDPSFAHCPMPRRGIDQKDRTAAIVMTYFHPFTLNPNMGDCDVPFLGHLCEASNWHDSLRNWCDGRVLCEESKRYLDNFFAVTRSRPEDDATENSDDAFSDEELDIDMNNFHDILKTRMGSGSDARRTNAAEDDADGDNRNTEDNVPENIKAAFSSAQKMWRIPADHKDGAAQASPTEVSNENLEKAFAAASASQKLDFGNAGAKDIPRDPSLRVAGAYSVKDVWQWFHKKAKEKNEAGKPLVKKAQLEMLRIVCQRVCDELEQADGQHCGPELITDPLMWMLHGTPGTGKSQVLLMLQEFFRDVCGWQMGMEFQMVALQAVMAQLLHGDTIHHALGINPFGQKTDQQAGKNKPKLPIG